MSGSFDNTKNTRSGDISPWSSDEMTTFQKKSILLNPEYKRGSSKATIQWEESVKGQCLEEKIKLDKRNRLHALGHLMSHGSKWSYVQEFMTKLKAEEGKIFRTIRSTFEEDPQGRGSPRAFDSLIRELWQGMLQKTVLKEADLTLDQQTKLELLKYRVKLENDKYLKAHPELDILLSLVYRKLLKTKPDDPKEFVGNYVHYLNAHREELVLDEVDVPFDRAPAIVLSPNEDMIDERQEIEVFVRELVQKCAEIASSGSAIVNVTKTIDSMLENIDYSHDESSYSSRRSLDPTLKSAESAVAGVLMSMLTSVAQARTRSAEIIVEEVLDSVFESVCPSVSRSSVDLLEVRESVELFVRTLLKTVTDNAARQAKRQRRLNKFEKNISGEKGSVSGEQDVLSVTSKSILKKLVPTQIVAERESSHKGIDKPELKSKVKFQSVTLEKTISKGSAHKENLND